MKKDEGLELLKTIVDKELVHEHYKRVTDLADFYFKLVTGEGIETLLKKIETRVTDEEFAQIKTIYRSIIPPTLHSTKLPFQKAVRKSPSTRTIDYEVQDDDKVKELNDFIKTYWGEKTLEKFLEYAFIDYNYLDPNAFLITEFSPFDYRYEKPDPYPFIASSKEVVMFKTLNTVLDYIVVKLPIKYLDNGVEVDGYKYTMYLGQDTIELKQVAGKGEGQVLELNNKYWQLIFYQPKNDKVPAIRLGFIKDPETKGETYVSVFHSIIGFLEKTLKIDSELDLSTSMVAFPQRLAYVTPCPARDCNQGFLPDGSACGTCDGTGIQQPHKGTQDVVSLTLPRNADPSQLIDLEKLLVYKSPPIELLKFQKEYLEYLKTTAYELMFNIDRFTRSQVSVTATQVIQEGDNLNDTLYPFAQQYSAIWEYVVRDIATFTDLREGLILQHEFPKDFKLKSLGQLMEELKVAKDAEASPALIAGIEDDINAILYYNKPDELQKMYIKNIINPFRGYSDANIRFIISNKEAPRGSIVLYSNLESIFSELELEYMDPWIYDMEITRINDIVKEKVKEYMKRIDEEKEINKLFTE